MRTFDFTPPDGTPMPLLVMIRETGFFAVDFRADTAKVAHLDAAVLPEAMIEAHARGLTVEYWVDTSVKHISPLSCWMVERARIAVERSNIGDFL